MPSARGSVYRRQLLRRLPFLVEKPIPGGGLRRELEAMYAWARERCGQHGFAVASRIDRGDPMTPAEFLQVRFADEATAKAFATTFDAAYLGEHASD